MIIFPIEYSLSRTFPPFLDDFLDQHGREYPDRRDFHGITRYPSTVRGTPTIRNSNARPSQSRTQHLGEN